MDKRLHRSQNSHYFAQGNGGGMSDSTLRDKEPVSLKGTVRNLVFPAILGACVTVFFFHFVPDMMDVLWDDVSFKHAFSQAWGRTYSGYRDLLNGRSENYGLLGWPILGAVIMLYIFRISKL
jgi:uncharacterized membrane protein YeaQ/YmgE (transglycosylase-associated protein family)